MKKIILNFETLPGNCTLRKFAANCNVGAFILQSKINGHRITNIGNSAFAACNLTKLILPNGLTTISDFAFSDCYFLTSINIPNTVMKIGKGVFKNCRNLREISMRDDIWSTTIILP